MDSENRIHAEPSPVWHLLILIVAGLLLWAATCGLWDLQGPDEGRYVQVAKELLGRGNWLKLTVGGDLYDEKLPPPFWVLAGMLKLNGGEPSAWLVRLPAVLAAIATVCMTYLIGRRRYGWRAGWISAWILMATPLFIENAPEAKLDMIFSCFVTLSLAPWLMRDGARPLSWPAAALMWCALAAAFFYKGPLAILILLSVIGWDARAARSWGVFNQAKAPAGLAFIVILIGGWYWLQRSVVGGGFVGTQIQEQTLQRFFHGDHAAPFWFYPPRVIGVFAPWSLLLIPIGIDFWRRRSIPQPLRPVVAWFVIPFVILSIASGKRQVYLLPLMPPLALLVGWWLAPRLSKSRAPKWIRPWAAGLLIVLGLAVPALYFAARLSPKLADKTHLMPTASILAISILIGIAIVISGAWLIARQATLPKLFAAVTAAILLFHLSTFMCLNPAQNAYASTRPFAAHVDQVMRERGLSALGGVEQAAKAEYYIYGHFPARRFEEDQLRGKLPMHAPLSELLIVAPGELKHIAPILDKAGYRLLFKETSAGDELNVFVKAK
ncbi:glycosyltransferase family 39 protein [bacterium]|nr:glycosyltransferase family 39 protein [bacterium]